MLSVFCAACMLLTALPAAGAVEPTGLNALSEFAGETISVKVIDDANEYLLNVAIPTGATLQEENTLVVAAARAAANGGISPKFVIPGQTSICAKSNAELNSSYTALGNGALKANYTKIYATFHNIRASGGVSQIRFRVEGVGMNPQTALGAIDDARCIVFISKSSTISFDKGTIFAYSAKTDKGSVMCDAVITADYL